MPSSCTVLMLHCLECELHVLLRFFWFAALQCRFSQFPCTVFCWLVLSGCVMRSTHVVALACICSGDSKQADVTSTELLRKIIGQGYRISVSQTSACAMHKPLGARSDEHK